MSSWSFALAMALAAQALAATAEPATGPLVATRTLTAAPHELTLPAKVGIFEAASDMALSFQVPGRVARILGVGARAAAGEELAALDSALERAELKRAELRLEQAQRELARARGLQNSRATSEKVVDSARIEVGLRRAELDVANEQLVRRQLIAPFAGVVAEVRIDPGEVAQPGVLVARLLNFDLLKLAVGLPGYQISRAAPGARVRVSVPALPEEVFEGTVHIVAPAAAQDGYLFEVEVLVPNRDARLRPGMGARARIVTRSLEAALAVPLDCMVERDGERVVFFVEEGSARAVPVGESALDGATLVLPATLPYRDLVVRGQDDLQDGMPVRIDQTIIADLPEGAPGVVPEARLK
jgi:membrane fusion protein (multidrug efflux system)